MESAGGGGSSELQRNILPEKFAEHLKALDAAVENIRSDYLILIGGDTSLKSIPNFTSPVISLEPKRMAATGTLAWTAFVKHIKQTRPEAFTGVAKESDKLEIVKRIRAHNMAAYNAFVEDWKAKHDAVEGKAKKIENPEGPVAWNEFIQATWRELAAEKGIVGEDDEAFKAAATAAGVTFAMARAEAVRRKAQMEGRGGSGGGGSERKKKIRRTQRKNSRK